jgi:class 3 adenylate cyclase/tetratricopeptide (TPR) repeat protein
MTHCAACGTDNRPGRRFCVQCGTALESQCPNCGAAHDPGDRFCGECGTVLAGGSPPAPTAPASPASVSERRLVSVLFADLVGFTTLSEHRDPEAVRELLSRYFDRCRTLIERYGGTVEKFIGDAVMAVWGTPVAREDDPERAVRAALALTQAITALGAEVGMPELRVRAGVLTGNAAVEVGADGQGMVLGDTVNTASRLQSLASPGAVLVDDVTRRASEAAIAYEDAGAHQVKGREQPVHAYTALRVVAGAGGARRSVGLEAPFISRDRELALVVEASDASAEESRARLLTVVGEAGMGKSRLLWEYFKYVDGVEKFVRWHQGRCLRYGEGVAYWALAEMVRSRAGILEEEEPASARAKLRSAVEEHVPDERERRLVEPRLAHLLGLEQRVAPDRADLFSGWRLFFERIAASDPVVLAFEDLEAADSGLLDFIDYLVEWSADFPIFVLALARPELMAARPAWSPTITLGPLDDDAMAELLAGLVPGLPEELAGQIRRRAEGVPLYAVETVRMLLDRGLVAQDGARYVVTGDVADLEVPETLQALAAARLDNLGPAERTLLQDAAVVGQSFTPATLSAIVERPAAEVQRLLDDLVAKQVLAYNEDVLSSERGQYAFLQALLRTVALSTLSRRDRKARHLAVARHLADASDEETGELAEVLASHYLEAVRADPEAPDAPAIRASARQTLADAGRRAISLALGPEARRHFEQAAELAEEPAVRGPLLREAGTAARLSGEPEDSLDLLTTAAQLLREGALPRDAARVEGMAGDILVELGRSDEAAERLAGAYAALDDGSDDEAFADLAASRARVAFMRGEREDALRLADTALRIADGQRLAPILVNALITKGNALAETGRPGESTALIRHAVQVALEQDLAAEAMRGYYNLAESVMGAARFAEADTLLERGLTLARQRGDRRAERMLLGQTILPLVLLGRWDEAVARNALLAETGDDIWTAQAKPFLPQILAARGDAAGLQAMLEQLGAVPGWAEIQWMLQSGRAVILRETGRVQEAVRDAREAALAVLDTAVSHVPVLFAEAVESAFAAGDPGVVDELLERVAALQPAQLIPMLDAEATRARARLAAHRGDGAAADQAFRRAIGLFRELDTPFALARTQLEHAELLGAAERNADEAQALRNEAASAFEALGAAPWLERARGLGSVVAA